MNKKEIKQLRIENDKLRVENGVLRDTIANTEKINRANANLRSSVSKMSAALDKACEMLIALNVPVSRETLFKEIDHESN